MTIENQDKGAGAAGDSQPAPQPIPPPAGKEPKFEMKEGAYFVDGKKMVKESDLIAAKQGLEKQLQTQQEAHTAAVDAVQLELSAARKDSASLSAKLKEAQAAPGQGAVSAEEIARIKQEKEDALAKVAGLEAQANRSLELRRQLLIKQYPGVTEEQLKDKTMVQLDSMEEALKAVTSSRGGGVGSYAVGGGLGQPAPLSDIDRAKRILENTPVRGVRNAPAAQ